MILYTFLNLLMMFLATIVLMSIHLKLYNAKIIKSHCFNMWVMWLISPLLSWLNFMKNPIPWHIGCTLLFVGITMTLALLANRFKKEPTKAKNHTLFAAGSYILGITFIAYSF